MAPPNLDGEEDAGAEPPPPAPRGAVVAESATTEVQHCQEVFELLRQSIVEPYEETATDASKLRQEAAAWLTAVCRADADLGGAPTWEELYAEGDRLVEAGCEHPLVMSFAGHADLLRGRLARSRERHLRATGPIEAGDYGPLPRYYQTFRLMRLAYHNAAPEDRYTYERKIREAWIDLAAAESENAAAQRMLLRNFFLLEGQFSGREDWQKYVTRVAAEDRLSLWLRAMVAGQEAYDRAWRIRGAGYVDTVDEEDWRPFLEALGDARTHYQLAYELHPEFPEAAGELVNISMADGNSDQMRQWFDEARAAQVDFLPAYRTLIHAMRPRWHGSHEEMLSLAKEWEGEGRFDTTAPYMAVQAVFGIGSELEGGYEKQLRDESTYQFVMSLLRKMADDPGNSVAVRREYARDTLLSHQIGVATKAGREEEAVQTLQTLVEEGLTPDAGVLRSYGLQPELGLPRLYARTGKAAKEVKAIGDLAWHEQRGDQDARRRTLARYREAKRQTADPRADGYFDHWISVYSQEFDFYDGKWVKPKFDKTFTDWYRPVDGFWEVESATAATARQSDNSGAPYMWTECHLSTPYEVEFEIEFLHETCPRSRTGVFAGAKKDGEGRYFWLTALGQSGGISRGRDDGEVRSHELAAKCVVLAKVWPGYGELWVDGDPVVQTELEDFEPSGYFALASVPRTGGASEAVYRNVKFRKLEPRDVEDEEKREGDDAAE